MRIAQPNSAATSHGTPASIFTAEREDTTTWSLNAETPRWWWISSPVSASRRRRPPLSSVPAAFAAAPGSHNAARPSRHGPQRPHAGTNASTT
ncbi:hypothetical protein LRS13_08425 [Svornostia abyssi]|uniref:Uncharacterized protein n=1 Tax=Svornostia abyssi TaxID=2898438 RepID=A0ABY5PLG9_9ACTN|nr:hypothetical protein LRS13_08425 [Parviterribacteraceae bacterium J379]